MKEIKPIHKDKVVIVKLAEQEKKLKIIGRIKPQPGHSLYQVNLKTGEVKKAKFEEVVARFTEDKTRQTPKNKRVIIEENCTYISALNIKNVVKKIKKAKTKLG